MASVIDSDSASGDSSPVGTPPRNGLLDRGAISPDGAAVRGAGGAGAVAICPATGETLLTRNTTPHTVGITALTSNPFLAWWSTRQGHEWGLRRVVPRRGNRRGGCQSSSVLRRVNGVRSLATRDAVY